MELITLTTEIREYFGLKSSHITIDNNDFIVMLKQMSDESVIFTCSNIDVKYGQIVILVFPSKYGKCEVEVEIDNFYDNDIMFVIEGKIRSHNENEFFIAFQNFMLDLINQKKRKEQRILCTKKNLEILHLINTFDLQFKYRQFRAVIKDISYSGLKILTNPLLLQENGDLFSFKIKFKDPAESYFFIKCHVIRKNLYTFEGQDFAEMVLELNDNIKFRNRIKEYFDYLERENNYSR